MISPAVTAADDSSQEKEDRPTFETVVSEGPITPVKRVTDEFPLSDQGNNGDWHRYEPMTDEFESDGLDGSKWWDHNPRWLGRQPAWFDPNNVSVADGKLHLTMRADEPTEMPKDKGYHTFTSAAVKSKTTVLYGYFEIKARPMNSAGSSAFWFYDSTPERWTEIDVFEIGAGAEGFERKDHMNVHVFRTPESDEHWALPGVFESATKLSEGYRVYGLEWGPREMNFYVDGVLVRRGENTHWHQPLTLNFDSETMPKWFGLPDPADLPSTFSIEYVRTWKRERSAGTEGKQRD